MMDGGTKVVEQRLSEFVLIFLFFHFVNGYFCFVPFILRCIDCISILDASAIDESTEEGVRFLLLAHKLISFVDKFFLLHLVS